MAASRPDRAASFRLRPNGIRLHALAGSGGDFLAAYRLVAWLSWVPNLAWAEWWVRRRGVRAGTTPSPTPEFAVTFRREQHADA